MSTLAGSVSSRPFQTRALGIVGGGFLALASFFSFDHGRALAPSQSAAGPGSSVSAFVSSEARPLATRENLPLSFAPNVGQAPKAVRYAARGADFSVAFTRREAFLTLVEGERGATIGLRFLGASAGVRLTASDRLPGTVNYLRGNDPAAWLTRVPTYSAVLYHGVWPGIDVRVSAKAGALKYAFLVHPGARVSDIRLAYRGIEGAALAANGSLVVRTPLGPMTDSRPVSYQRIGGKRVPVDSAYALAGGTSYGFSVGTYDATRTLVIDPELRYSTYVGGTRGDLNWGGVAVDRRGNAYVAGATLSPNFPTTPGAFRVSDTDPAGEDIYVAKLNRDGSALVYSSYLGGSSPTEDQAWAIAVDTRGNAYVTGLTESPDFPTTPAAFDRTPSGDDTYVTKLNRDGSGLVYSTFLGGSADDDGLSIAVDRKGHAYVSGGTFSTDFPTTRDAFDQTHNGGSEVFVAKFNRRGSRLVYSTFMGGASNEVSQHALAVDRRGYAYVAGRTRSPNFPTTPHAFQAADPDPTGDDSFAAKLNPRGSRLVYSTYLGGPGSTTLDNDRALGLAIDKRGHAYLAGRADSAAFPTTPGSFDTTFNGAVDAYVAKLSRDGSALVYSTFLGGTAVEAAFHIDVDADGNAYPVGQTTSPNFPVTADAFQPAFGGGTDGWVAILSARGDSLDFSTFLGRSGFDAIRGVDWRHRTLYISGHTDASDWPTTPDSFQPVGPGTWRGSGGTRGRRHEVRTREGRTTMTTTTRTTTTE